MKFPRAVIGICLAWPGLAPAADTVATAPKLEDDTVLMMQPFVVEARAAENFGFQVRCMSSLEIQLRRVPDQRPATTVRSTTLTPEIIAVLPNTAAAKAGLKPGDLILRSDGVSVEALSRSAARTWRGFYIPPKQAADLAAGKIVRWTLEIQSGPFDPPRVVVLNLPTPPPHWGARIWTPPADRPVAEVSAPGPLAERAREVLSNGVAVELLPQVEGILLRIAVNHRDPSQKYYQWSAAGRAIVVTQDHGSHTSIILENGRRFYLTSPSGVLDHALVKAGAGFLGLAGKWEKIPLAAAQGDFRKEVEFWLNSVGKVSSRWPLELIPGKSAFTGGSALSPLILKLPTATPGQRALLEEALGKVGSDYGRWAYTETVHGGGIKNGAKEAIVRVDPSKSESERVSLRALDGKMPTAAEVGNWRQTEGDRATALLGGIPPLAQLLDLSQIRLSSDGSSSIVFEVAPKFDDDTEISPDKLQALLRVNKATRSLESIAITTRAAIHMTGLELEIRFGTIDPAYPPQPISIRASGTAGIGCFKISRNADGFRPADNEV